MRILVFVAGAFRFLIILFWLGFFFRLVVLRIRVLAQLVAIAQIVDYLPREAGKGGLILKLVLQPLQSATGLLLDKSAPKLHHIRGRRRQVSPRCQMPQQIPCCVGQGGITG